MTHHLLVSGPTESGRLLSDLEGGTDLDSAAIRTLGRAMLKDAVHAVEASGGGLVVAPTDDAGAGSGETPAEVVDLVEVVTDAFETAPTESWGVGDPAAIAEQAVGSLLEREAVTSVAVLDGRAPTIDRSTLDSAAMKLRRSEVVHAPGTGGGVAYLGLSEPLALGNLSWPLRTTAVVELAVEAGYDVDFLPLHPWLGSRRDLHTLVSLITARQAAGRRVPEFTAEAISALGLGVVDAPTRQRLPTDRD